jgi:hypothetical protein
VSVTRGACLPVSVDAGFRVYHGVSRATTQRKNKMGRDRDHRASWSEA